MRVRINTVLFAALLISMLAACGSASQNTSSSNTGNSNAASTKSSTSNSSSGSNTTSASGTVCAGNTTAYTIVGNQSQASYSVQEQFLNRNLPNQAVGKTNGVQGSFLLTSDAQPTITTLKITVNLTTLTSDEQRRDASIRQQWLESDTYPLASFQAKNVKMNTSGSQGQAVSFNMTGNMTIHNTTHQETFKVTGKRVGDTISGTATTSLFMKNYGFNAPNIAGILTVKDGVAVTLNFTAQKGNCSQAPS